MNKTLNHEFDFESIVTYLKEDYPNHPESAIRKLLEERLLSIFKEQIMEMEIPPDITVKGLRLMRGGINVMQKSHRWDKKISSKIKLFNRDRYYLKLKGIQTDLKTWHLYSENNNWSVLTNGSAFKHLDGTFYNFNGNKDIDTMVENKTRRGNQNQAEIDRYIFNEGGSESDQEDFKSDFGSFEDSLKEVEKLDKVKEEEEEIKIAINHDLSERIKEIKIKPTLKEETRDLSIDTLFKDLNKLDESS